MLIALGLFGCSEYDVNDESSIGRAGTDPIEPTATSLEARIVTDEYTTPPKPPLDVLFVVDNSCSMEEEQNAIAQEFPAFVDVLKTSGIDWHAGVVSTDMMDPDHRGALRESHGYKWLDAQTPFAPVVWEEMFQLGTSGHYDEEGRAAAFTALEILRNGRNAGFVREDAKLQIVVISDENDYSTQPTIKEFTNWLLHYKDDPRDVVFSAITGPPGFSCAVEAGRDYYDVVDQIGGVKWNICDPHWSLAMSALTDLDILAYERTFQLSHVPRQFSLDVTIEEADVTYVYEKSKSGCASCYEYDPITNSIQFAALPPEYATLRIAYELLD